MSALPAIEGPVDGEPTLFSTRFDLASVGYEQAEYFISGEAQAYEMAGPASADGRWSVRPGATAAYRLRLVVYRPIDPVSVNGAVAVEWINVSAGRDYAPAWVQLHREAVRRGMAWVAASVQAVGVEGGPQVSGTPSATPLNLKGVRPERYGALHHPGDGYSFDIFSQAGRIVREAPERILGPQRPGRVLAVGTSQSAIFLATYLNAVAPRDALFDGYLVHEQLIGRAPGIDGTLANIRDPDLAPTRIRTDLAAPVIAVQMETDALNAYALSDDGQEDAPLLRVWQVAGTAHANTYTTLSPDDSGLLPLAEIAERLRPRSSGPILGGPGYECAAPINSGPHNHYVTQAALRALDRWAATGEPAPGAPRLARDPADPRRPRPDRWGITMGGVRTPWVDAPANVLGGPGGPNDAGVECSTRGHTLPLPDGALATLYPGGKADYLAAFARSADAAVAAGFLTPEDAEEAKALSAFLYPD